VALDMKKLVDDMGVSVQFDVFSFTIFMLCYNDIV
jgi:hypothetical protein